MSHGKKTGILPNFTNPPVIETVLGVEFTAPAEQPSLLINDLKHGQSRGVIAWWVGPWTVSHFSNLRVSK